MLGGANSQNPKWYAAYCKVLEAEPVLARIYMQAALASIDERLRASEISAGELESIHNAIRYLNLIRDMELQNRA